jgi:hypothetical protein
MANGRGRDRRRETRWRRLVRGQLASGLTIREFFRGSELAESAFYFWRGELDRREAQRRQAGQGLGTPERGESGRRAGQRRREGVPTGSRPPTVAGPSAAARTSAQGAFVPVRLVEELGPRPLGRIEIELPDGRRVHVTGPVNRQALADVLAVLSQDSTSGSSVGPEAQDSNGASSNSHRAEGRPSFAKATEDAP